MEVVGGSKDNLLPGQQKENGYHGFDRLIAGVMR